LPSLVADKVAGLHGVYGVMAAIIHKLRTGRGQHVEVPMFESFTNFMMVEHLGGQTFDPPVGPVGYFRQIDPDRQPFPTSDGYVSIVAYTDEAWPIVFELLGDRGFLAGERFSTRSLRNKNLAALYQRMAQLTPNFTTTDLVARCQAAQIPAQPVTDLADVQRDPHLTAVGFFRQRQHPTEGAYYEIQPPVRFSDAETTPRAFPPQRGEHSGEIEAELRARQPVVNPLVRGGVLSD
jgi:crotonobetainyl-CoA:carnitine CoA-transferase CaiB-like acyl-CoA transferase